MVKWLEKWYLDQCDGEWEHTYGVEICTLDNPGWHLKIDLVDTELEDKIFEGYKEYIDENNWIICQVRDNKFDAGGDSLKLNKMIDIFKRWSES